MTGKFSFTRTKTTRRRTGFARTLSLAAAFCASVFSTGRADAQTARLELKNGDRVVFIGNTFAERQQLFPYFETLVTITHPDLDLTFINLAWSADTLTSKPRPKDFGDQEVHLAKHQADVIIACFGMGESFDGPEGLAQFEQDWQDFIARSRAARYNGESAPRLAIISPIAHEVVRPKLPNPEAHNRNLEMYSEAMRKIAAQHDIPFVDLFHPTSQLSGAAGASKMTINGIHANDYGSWATAQVMLRQLRLAPESGTRIIDAGRIEGPAKRIQLFEQQLPFPPPPQGAIAHQGVADPTISIRNLEPGRYELQIDGKTIASHTGEEWERGVSLDAGPAFDRTRELHELIIEKNRLFFDDYRAVNGYYIYGGRKKPFGVVSFPPEIQRYDELRHEAEAKIHELSRPEPFEPYRLVKVGGA